MNLSISDLPATTSEVIYRVTYHPQNSGSIYTNSVGGWAGQSGDYELGTSSMTLMEIAQ
jgi:hypothetical protein